MLTHIDVFYFVRFSEEHGFHKPNDETALRLMNASGEGVMKECAGEVLLGYGQSDEYSFVFKRNTSLFKRRARSVREWVRRMQ